MMELPLPRLPAFPVYGLSDFKIHGYTDAEIRRALQQGIVEYLGFDAYGVPPATDDPFEQRLSRYKLRCVARALRAPTTIVSHLSAAALHGLPADTADLGVVHLTAPGRGGSRVGSGVHRHVGMIDPVHWVRWGPIRVTTLPRTLVDVARTEPEFAAVAILDAALHQRLTTPQEIADSLASAVSFQGMGAARRACSLVDGRSESVGESRCRLFFSKSGLPQPQLQVAVYSQAGKFLGRVDFGYRDSAVLVEFDGAVKYGKLRRPGEQATDAVLREKRRQERLEDAGFVVVRVCWQDLQQPDALRQRIRQALHRGRRSMAAGVVDGYMRVGRPVRIDHTAGLDTALRAGLSNRGGSRQSA